jgi:PAS domain S-box-containing protein
MEPTAILDGVPVPVLSLDATGALQWCNAAWLALVGRARDEELGRGWLDHLHGDDRAQIVECIEKSAELAVACELPVRIDRPDGTARSMLVQATPTLDGRGRTDSFVATVLDLTSLHALEEQVAAREVQARLAMGASTVGVWSWDTETNIVEWSPEMEAVFGLPAGGFSRGFDEFVARVHPDDRARVVETIAAADAEQRELAFEHRIVRTDGEVRWIEGRGRPVVLRDGKPPVWFGVGIDITDRRRAQERLFGTMATLRLALNIGGMGLWTWTSRAGFVVGDSMRRLAGFRPDQELDAERILAAVHPDDRDAIRALFVPPDPDAREIRRRCRFVHDNGDIVWVENRAMPLRAASTDAVTWVGVSIDITDRVRREAELQDKQQRLDMLSRVGLLLGGTRGALERVDAVLAELTLTFADFAALEIETGVIGSSALVRAVAPRVSGVPVRVVRGDADPPLEVVGRALATMGRDEVRGTTLDRVCGSLLDAIDAVEILAVPLRAHVARLGTLAVARRDRQRFTPESEVLAVELARRLALTLQAAAVHEREHEIAEFLQRSLLPDRLEQPRGVELAARYLAGTDLQIGGDFFDVIALGDDEVLLAIGDVAGRGELAAVTMGRLRNALRAFVSDGTTGPAALLDKLDRYMLRESLTMTTVLCLCIRPHDGTMVASSAGHPPALAIDRDGGARWLDVATAPPLGVLERVQRAESAAQLAPGTLAVLYTDGLVERRGEILDDGMARLAAAATRLSSPLDGDPADVSTLADRLLDELAEHDRADDVALLCVRLTAAD